MNALSKAANGADDGDQDLPSVPMLCERVERGVPILHLSERPLIDNVRVARVVKQTGCYPRLIQARVQSLQCGIANNERTSSTSQPPRLTPRTARTCVSYDSEGGCCLLAHLSASHKGTLH